CVMVSPAGASVCPSSSWCGTPLEDWDTRGPTDGPDGAHPVFRWVNTANGSTVAGDSCTIAVSPCLLPAFVVPQSAASELCPAMPFIMHRVWSTGARAMLPPGSPHAPHHSGEFGESLDDFLPKCEELADVYQPRRKWCRSPSARYRHRPLRRSRPPGALRPLPPCTASQPVSLSSPPPPSLCCTSADSRRSDSNQRQQPRSWPHHAARVTESQADMPLEAGQAGLSLCKAASCQTRSCFHC
ncbi:hypothetical protein BC826DRAFT_1078703, partial [Russula brevipes]